MEQVKDAPGYTLSPGASTTVLVVDDHEGFREALRELIAATPGFTLIGEASLGEEATQAVAPRCPDLVLMDIATPGMGGVQAARWILSRHPEVAVVFISANDPSLNPEVEALGDVVGRVRKHDLRPRQLRELWESRAN